MVKQNSTVSTGGTANYDESLYEGMVQRLDKYKVAAGYAMKEMKCPNTANKMLLEAEKLKSASLDYKTTNRFVKSNLSPVLTPRILFGMTIEEKEEKFQAIIDEYEAEIKTMSDKARKCIEGSKQVKNAKEQANLK